MQPAAEPDTARRAWLHHALGMLGAAGALLALPAGARAGKPEGYLGLALSVRTESWLSTNPTLVALTVAKVEPGSPAALAGVTAGEQVMRVEDIEVAGAKANTLRPLMNRKVGESTTLVFKRADGGLYTTRITSVAKPARS